jgi:hypothetical protein
MTLPGLIERAHARYRRDARDRLVAARPLKGGDVIKHRGLNYAVLSDVAGVVVIYREGLSGELKEIERGGAVFAKIAGFAGFKS